MEKKQKKRLGTGIFFLVLSIAYLLGTMSIHSFSPFGERGLDSKSVPQVLAFFMIVLSFIQIAGTFFGVTEKSDETKEKKQVVPLFLSILFFILYIYLFDNLGFVISSVLYLFSMIFLLAPAGRRKSSILFFIVFSIIVPLLVYFLFSKCLSLILPKGILNL